jgi:protease-4
MAGFTPPTFIFQRIVRGSLSTFLWGTDAFARLVRRRPEYNTLRLDISEPPEEEHTTSLRSIIQPQGPDLLSIMSLLRWAREDEKIRAVVLTVSGLDIGWARLQSLRRSLTALRQADKQVWVHLTEAGMREYYLASAANTIVVAPAGHLTITGLAAETMFFKGALDKLGVEAQVIQAGQYKAAGEPFTRESMSPAHRDMMDGLLDDLYDQIIEGIGQDRNKEKAHVRDLIDQGLFLAREALESGLVDHIAYEDALPDLLESVIGPVKPIEADVYQRRRGKTVRRQSLRGDVRTIALMTLDGVIKHGETTEQASGSRAIGSTDFIRDLKEISEQPDISALVVRIASPGGSGLASDLMWHELLRLRTQMPIIISMGDVAASGGYFLALAGDQVFAEEGTITGSIGVIAGKAVLQNLYSTLGVEKEILTRGRRAALFSDYVALTPHDQARLELEVQAFYQDFIGKVADCRGLSLASVEPHAQGRVWSGRQAWARGLVDTIGGLEEAIGAAKTRIGVPESWPVRMERFPKPSPMWRLSGLLRLLPGAQLTSLANLIGLVNLVNHVNSNNQVHHTELWWRRERLWAIVPVPFRFL